MMINCLAFVWVQALVLFCACLYPQTTKAQNVERCFEHPSLRCCTDSLYPVLGGADVVEARSGKIVQGLPEWTGTYSVDPSKDEFFFFWFSSKENMLVFSQNPTIFIPRYGGFDPFSLCTEASKWTQSSAPISFDLSPISYDLFSLYTPSEGIVFFSSSEHKNHFMSLENENVYRECNSLFVTLQKVHLALNTQCVAEGELRKALISTDDKTDENEYFSIGNFLYRGLKSASISLFKGIGVIMGLSGARSKDNSLDQLGGTDAIANTDAQKASLVSGRVEFLDETFAENSFSLTDSPSEQSAAIISNQDLQQEVTDMNGDTNRLPSFLFVHTKSICQPNLRKCDSGFSFFRFAMYFISFLSVGALLVAVKKMRSCKRSSNEASALKLSIREEMCNYYDDDKMLWVVLE